MAANSCMHRKVFFACCIGNARIPRVSGADEGPKALFAAQSASKASLHRVPGAHEGVEVFFAAQT